MRTAVLVIDVQQGLCSGRYEVFEAPRVIDRINLVTDKARRAGASVVLIQHESPPPSPLAHGSAGWQLAEGLDVRAGDLRIRKTTPDSFHDTELLALLQERGMDRLVICGMQSDFCVDTTTRRALALLFPVTLVSDGHSTLDNSVLSAAQIAAHHNITLANISSFGPRVTPMPAGKINFEIG